MSTTSLAQPRTYYKMSSIDQQKKLNKRICQKYQNSPWPSLAQLQKATSLDTPTPAPARGGVWIARTSFSAPTNPAIRDVLYTVIHRLKKEYHRISPVEETPVIDVGVEFIGPRSQVPDDAPEPDIPEEEKLRALLQECNSELTILYAHGGGLYFSSPAQYRASSIGLAKLTGARVASIKYRLTPSHTFPASILDILVAYASLLYPLAADQIILAGNSAGANITLGLMKLLLEVQKLPPSDSVALPLPCDQCDSLPSWHCNGETDILTVLQPACMPGHPTHSIWPASPPREVPYCVAATLDHELRGVNGNRVVASQAAKSGVTVIWNEYEGMPHEFPIFLSALPQIHLLLQLWAAACQAFAGGKIGARELQSGAVRCLMPDCKPMVLGSPVGIAPLPFEEVRKRMEYNATRPDWTGKLHEHKL
ncbi:hypothetical protein AO1008_03329 [Aspergillus oryzae 100-8]|uniref:Alpha/beta hydrolase fold-3 domain-containing protein n=1 Tax=Aspergillus oryzae (strain 3.042) TaxID=1160506 RepID=I8TXS3_ASPO3|nr:hypothetical protein Ao3042_04649 [Aspergillus oryzae 3.042]KDE77638.1 hypothetical protein AO1008_03329 [Aspergillus oryzae 100-8]|eukprot:EIT79038.1 hypothetical protein Ao3042_04649 [Aspergillus oryzae 3.042]